MRVDKTKRDSEEFKFTREDISLKHCLKLAERKTERIKNTH